jgi:hypothetical protein
MCTLERRGITAVEAVRMDPILRCPQPADGEDARGLKTHHLGLMVASWLRYECPAGPDLPQSKWLAGAAALRVCARAPRPHGELTSQALFSWTFRRYAPCLLHLFLVGSTFFTHSRAPLLCSVGVSRPVLETENRRSPSNAGLFSKRPAFFLLIQPFVALLHQIRGTRGAACARRLSSPPAYSSSSPPAPPLPRARHGLHATPVLRDGQRR